MTHTDGLVLLAFVALLILLAFYALPTRHDD